MNRWEGDALRVINILAPITRRDEWWGTEWCRSTLADELQRMYGRYIYDGTIDPYEYANEFNRE